MQMRYDVADHAGGCGNCRTPVERSPKTNLGTAFGESAQTVPIEGEGSSEKAPAEAEPNDLKSDFPIHLSELEQVE